MKQVEMRQGSRMVVISEQEAEGKSSFSARLYLNHGETASLQSWRGKTRKGAEAWARNMLSK